MTSQESQHWSVIVVTSHSRDSALMFHSELLIRQKKGIISPLTNILVVDDPKPNIGSGSATLNALIVVTELLSSKAGYKTVNADVFPSKRVLILHAGRLFPFVSCNSILSPLPLKDSPYTSNYLTDYFEIPCEIDHLLGILDSYIGALQYPGVWVCATDILLTTPISKLKVEFGQMKGVKLFTTRASPEYAKSHGVCKVSRDGEFRVENILFQSEDTSKYILDDDDGSVSIISGISFISTDIVDILVSLHTMPPLDACTYMGLDSGAQSLSLSLFYDVFRCLASDVTQEEFIESSIYVNKLFPYEVSSDNELLKSARNILWRELKSFDIPLSVCFLPGCAHNYPRFTGHQLISFAFENTHRHTHCFVISRQDAVGEYASSYADFASPFQQTTLDISQSVVINSCISESMIIGSGSLIIHCNLEDTSILFGKGSLLVSLDSECLTISSEIRKEYSSVISFPDNLTLQKFFLKFDQSMNSYMNVYLLFACGTTDNINSAYTQQNSTFLNKPWSDLFSRTGITPEDLWEPGTNARDRNLCNAKLFTIPLLENGPTLVYLFWLLDMCYTGNTSFLERWRSQWRISLNDVLKHADFLKESQIRRKLTFEIGCRKMFSSLINGESVCFLSFFRGAYHEGLQFKILEQLDDVSLRTRDITILCRILSTIADLLSIMAGDAGGIRGGPAANIHWQNALSLLEHREWKSAIHALAVERNNWLDRPDRILRASRHYERAAQIITSLAVLSVEKFIGGTSIEPIEIGRTLILSAPARVDWGGGWSDTPPITYEIGGAVLNFALEIDGKLPIRVEITRLKNFHLELVTSDGDSKYEVICRELKDISDYNQPHAPASLLKACFICTKLLSYPNKKSLEQQLRETAGSGFRIVSISYVPHGSGLGTSSILAGATLGALWRAIGCQHDNLSLCHAVLCLEQLLTTGGGWQDQVGGIFPGAKLSWIDKGLPLEIHVDPIPLSNDILDKFNSRLILIYTGKTRLARNLLQDVLRNWHARLPEIVENISCIAANGRKGATALKDGDFETLGACLSESMSHKLIMAPGCLPHRVDIYLKKVHHKLLGYQLAGAGGGGFLMAFTKESNQQSWFEQVLKETPEMFGAKIYPTKLSASGLSYQFLD